MKIRRIRIWLSRGWYRTLCSVSLLLLPLFTSCSSSKSASKNAGTNNSEVAENKETDLTAQDGLSVLFNSNDGSSMRLMYGVQPPTDKENSYPLIVLNGKIINVDKDKLDVFDFEKDINSKEKVATLLDVDEKTVFASCLMTDPSSITIWGTRGRNGVFEVVDKKRYRRYKSYNDYQRLK